MAHPHDSSSTALETYVPEGGVTRAESTQPGATALAARVEAEVKARTLVAINRPRNVDRFRKRILESCASERFSEAAWYAKPIGGSKVYGFSIRFAEELVCAPTSTWRNASAASALAGSASAVRWVVHEYPLQVRFDPHFGPRFGTPSVGQP